jgi:hypothetical protein
MPGLAFFANLFGGDDHAAIPAFGFCFGEIIVIGHQDRSRIGLNGQGLSNQGIACAVVKVGGAEQQANFTALEMAKRFLCGRKAAIN